MVPCLLLVCLVVDQITQLAPPAPITVEVKFLRWSTPSGDRPSQLYNIKPSDIPADAKIIALIEVDTVIGTPFSARALVGNQTIEVDGTTQLLSAKTVQLTHLHFRLSR